MDDLSTLTFAEAAERVTNAFKEYVSAIEQNRPYRVVKEHDNKVKGIINGWAGNNRTRYRRIAAHYERLVTDRFGH